jgi:hypothetical protein
MRHPVHRQLADPNRSSEQVEHHHPLHRSRGPLEDIVHTPSWPARPVRAVPQPGRSGSIGVRLGLTQPLCGALLVAGCAPGVSHEQLQAEPVLASPPGAVELGRAERTAERTLLGEVSGYVRVFHATPADPEALVEHYLDAHGDTYSFAVNDRHGSRSGSGRATVLTASRGDVRVSVFIDTVPRTGSDDSALQPLPPEAHAVATVIVQSP